MKVLVAVGILVLAVVVNSQEFTTESPECSGVKDAVKGAFRACGIERRGRRPQSGVATQGDSSQRNSTDERQIAKDIGRTCVLEKFEANETLSEFVKDCPESAHPDKRDRLGCIKAKMEEKCKNLDRHRGGRRGGNRRPGGPRDESDSRVTPRDLPDDDQTASDLE